MSYDHVVTRYHEANKKLYISSSTRPITNKLCRMVTKETGSHLISHLTLSSHGRVRLHDILTTLDFLSQKNYGNHTLKGQGLGKSVPRYWVLLPLDYKITWQMKNLDKKSNFYSTRL